MVFDATSRVNRRKPRVRTLSGRAIVHAIDGMERPYPAYKFSRRVFAEKPRHNPFKGL